MKIKGFPSDQVAWGLITMAALYLVAQIIRALYLAGYTIWAIWR